MFDLVSQTPCYSIYKQFIHILLVLNDIYFIYVWLGIAVTTTSQAKTALTMLRENKDKFDLVIADVHLPDMDGLQLLELVELETDLPVVSKWGDLFCNFQFFIFVLFLHFHSFIHIIINQWLFGEPLLL